MKLNNNKEKLEQGHPDYNLAYKYNLVYKVLVGNTNIVTKNAELDLYGNQTTYGFMGYDEANSGAMSKIMGKNHVLLYYSHFSYFIWHCCLLLVL